MFIPEDSGEKQGYRPHNPAYRIKGDPQARYIYLEGQQERDFKRLAEAFPELALVIKSIEAIGLMPCCPEMVIWMEFYRRIHVNGESGHSPTHAKRIAESICGAEDADERFRRLYYTLVLPVAAAVDTGHIDIAHEIYTAAMDSINHDCGIII